MDLNFVQVIAVYAVPVILAITLHEAAHGYVAMRFGDMTAYAAGRVTLNPIRHIDPVGTVALPLALLAIAKLFGGGGMLFGWAKPVPVNFANLRHPRRDMIWVAAAGPGSNFVQALLWALVLAAGAVGGSEGFARMAVIGVQVNLVLMALNLLPIPPLDGGRILAGLLPHGAASALSRIEPWGFFIILALLFARLLDDLMYPLIKGAFALITMLLSPFGVPVPAAGS
jgi:Zn-dependent protease